MKTQVIEGTFAEIKTTLNRLFYAPETRLRIVLTEPEKADFLPLPYQPTEFRNGVPLLPRRPLARPVTMELVRQLLNGENL